MPGNSEDGPADSAPGGAKFVLEPKEVVSNKQKLIFYVTMN
jgi:hypothetical protein